MPVNVMAKNYTFTYQLLDIIHLTYTFCGINYLS
uniref:Uncharacterized protein n=1 Tax=Anguilla anguilla TaxID=7936 RepID=A0A0E9SUR3_ANGAN